MQKQFRITCAFCGKPGSSKEHLWPNWLRKFVPMPLEATATHSVISFQNDTVDVRKGRLRGRPFATTIKNVCTECNNTWMSQLQNRAKPDLLRFISGQDLDWSESGRLRIATWATMFTYTFEQAEQTLITSTPAERRNFSLTQQPPPGWLFFTGKFEGQEWQGASWRRAMLADPIELSAHAFTFVLGKQIVHVVKPLGLIYGSEEITDIEEVLQLRSFWPFQSDALPQTMPIDDSQATFIAMFLIRMLAENAPRVGGPLDPALLDEIDLAAFRKRPRWRPS